MPGGGNDRFPGQRGLGQRGDHGRDGFFRRVDKYSGWGGRVLLKQGLLELGIRDGKETGTKVSHSVRGARDEKGV